MLGSDALTHPLLTSSPSSLAGSGSCSLAAPLSLVASLVAVRLFNEWFSFLPTGSIEPLRSELDLTYGAGGRSC